MKITVIILSILALTTGCMHRWTEKQRKEFSEECSKTDTIDGLTFFLTGFTYDEIENIMIKQIHNGQVVDSFYVYPNKNTYDSLRTRYSAHIEKSLYIKDTFQFVVRGHDPFILSDMKMIMWAQYTMLSEGWGCVMGDYKIDGVRFEHDTAPDFRKKVLNIRGRNSNEHF